MANTLSPGHDTSFGTQQSGSPSRSGASVLDLDPGQPRPTSPTWTASTSGSTSSTIRRSSTWASGLIAPSGQHYELFTNETIFKNPADPFVGLPSGTSVGVQVNPPHGDPPYYEVGTIFDDNATRNIVDLIPGTNGSRGARRPTSATTSPRGWTLSGFGPGGTLDEFLQTELNQSASTASTAPGSCEPSTPTPVPRPPRLSSSTGRSASAAA